MKTALLVAVLLAVPAFAQGKPAEKAPVPHLNKMGPWNRRPTNEAQVKREIQDFFKRDTELLSKGDFDGVVQTMAFPVYLLTDDDQGAVHGTTFTRDEWVKLMKPFIEDKPHGSQLEHKLNINVLSDALAVVVDDFTVKMDKEKLTSKNCHVLAKIDGQWKVKSTIEAGWGALSPPEKPTGGALKK